MSRAFEIETALETLGELLESRGLTYEIVAIGGGALWLMGLLTRPTKDVDVLATVREGEYETANPLPDDLQSAIEDVASSLGIPTDWMNPGPTKQLEFGLPKGFKQRVETRRYGGLILHLAGKFDQILFKFYAAVDQFPDEKHLKDLRLLSPTREQLLEAAGWACSQDVSPEFREMSRQALAYLGVEEDRDGR
ncbi:MAG: DUF6036 family nucleotidyltransferase [Polyangia bacterium]